MTRLQIGSHVLSFQTGQHPGRVKKKEKKGNASKSPPTAAPTPQRRPAQKPGAKEKEKCGARTASSPGSANGQAARAGSGDVGASAAQAEEEGPPLSPRPPEAQPPPRDAAGGRVPARAAPPLHPPQPRLLRRLRRRPPREEAPPRDGTRRRLGQGGRASPSPSPIRLESAPTRSNSRGIHLIWRPCHRGAYGSAPPRDARGIFFPVFGMKSPHLFIYSSLWRQRSTRTSARTPIICEINL
jgi:hypothetical protein